MGAGIGIDSLDDRDKESVISDPFSKIVGKPTDIRSLYIMLIFNSTPYTYNQNGLEGFNYLALKDTIKWHRLRPREFVPILLSVMNYYIKGIHSKNKT